ncbi:endolytic transglycosylase MltG [Marinimicrobium alkaliphilum]|uniref:endolytic transglycosylase MltG n=1 Tax=Marinimicrobium alkaliphilum TaxID=2202654 RepID=UPI000DB9881E|nr:endolytic transglycosylase MltG [Marinimicrobium alkaliphilum]
MVRHVVNGVVALTLCAIIVALAGVAYVWRWVDRPLNLPAEGMTYELAQGRSLHHLARDLGGEGVLDHPRLLIEYARLMGVERVQAGEYRFGADTSPRQLLDKLAQGDVVLHTVTLVEGWTFQQALTAMHALPSIRPLLAGLDEDEQLALLDLDIEHPEGWFFPDTYRFARGTTDVDILRRAHRQMRGFVDEFWDERAGGLPYDNAYEALIMASIIERETGAPWERQDIAGVFVRRLEQGMRLQTDPTVIYGMGEDYQGRITRADLRRPTPYNTYTIRGLPPTPIALPGRDALWAALNPSEGTALYFVARGDGTHVFSDTLEDHNRAVNRYQRQRREGYRSTLDPDAAPPEAEAGDEPEG